MESLGYFHSSSREEEALVLLLTGIGALILEGCATDGHSPQVSVGVSGRAPTPLERLK